MSKPYYVTTPIYYLNARPHIGTAYTTVAGDVLARFHRLQHRETFFLTGVAEHGQKIGQKSAEEGLTAQEFGDRNAQYFTAAWQALHISEDDFLRTSESRHEAAVQAFFEKLKASGDLYEGEYEGLYCIGHEAFVKESDLTEEGRCPDHDTVPERVNESNWFFRLSAYQERLLELIESGQLVVAPESRRNEVISFIRQGLEDIAVSRQNVEWAFTLPWDDAQTIYVWLDELFSYCTAVGYGQDRERFEKWWPADVHIVGKDIIKFHCVIWPALLLAINEAPPKKVFAHGFFTVDGQKVSKSLGNVIDPVQVVEEYSADVIRYFMLREIAFGSDGDFSLERLRERYNADLANGLGNVVSRTLALIEKYVPELPTVAAPPELVDLLLAADEKTEHLLFTEALKDLWQALAWIDTFLEESQPWIKAKEGKMEEVVACLGTAYAALAAWTPHISPYMPEVAERLEALLAARPLKKPVEPLFLRLDN